MCQRTDAVCTYTVWQGVVPLRQVVRDTLAAYGGGAVKDVAGVALELHHGSDGKLVSKTPPEAWLGDRTALGGAGPRHGWRNRGHNTTD